MFSIVYNLWLMVEDVIVQYIDLDFTLWLTWLLMPLLITFLLPLVIALLLYLTALMLYIYKLHRVRLRNAYGTAWRDTAVHMVAAVWDAHGWIWHGYEIVGLENIPQDKPVLFIYYHGALPVDIYYFASKVFLYNSKLIRLVVDRFLFKIPGWSIFADVLKIIPGTVQSCSAILKEGNMLAIAPGGVYEALFGDSYYELMWKKRMGFAKVALDAKVSIVPFFTKNLRESFRAVSWGRKIWLKIYSKTKLPLVPIYGGFPVKLVTYIGKPIPYDENLTPEELQIKVADSLKELIKKHQKVPGNITRALMERIRNTDRHKD
ncbi:PREDICTED: transmembrane protein 68 [Cyphomyrmex costatus]|uniref:Transmembrane protein 68 n=1 Tax=Cyphomyrmex costatus TaxID=456900 RepID=A0A151IM47_9HYME|nr:PREDICTED: transmembrane protein 68 [Cyphomyrmex costatus]KYN05962.1 Transmembrane protein 68 [Cyphomyrmex costatus]